tara:strand:+ start:212 stop:757 length:546 start_codon:yes stop_codon:yes gene_type:complete
MNSIRYIKTTILVCFFSILLTACNGKLPGGDARKFPDDPKLRVKKNLEEGRGFRLKDQLSKQMGKGGVFEFASSNELWRASLDAIDFMPLASVNYSGGIIITDWYSNDASSNESIKISIRFLTNEIRADALDIKIFNKICNNISLSCKTIQTDGPIANELKKKILKTATLLKKEKEEEKNN